MGESLLIVIAMVLMVISLIVSIVPFVPGPLLLWLVALGFGFVEGFDRLPPALMIAITVLMFLGVTTEFWTPLLGMRSQGASCWSTIGTIVGAIAGTFLIPIPLCGTLIGAVGGALIFELLRVGDLQRALRASQTAIEMMVLSMVVEFIISLMIFATFVISLMITG